MSITDDLDSDALISRLSGPLLPPDRIAFRRAAEDALTRVPCWGEGAVYRTVASLQRSFFDPPSDVRALWGIEQELAHARQAQGCAGDRVRRRSPSRPPSQACTMRARHVLVLRSS